MKRIHLFELEDFPWFPNWIRTCLTKLIVVMHRALGSADELTVLLSRALAASPRPAIVDLCSGSGGPMPAVFEQLQAAGAHPELELVLTDLYPNREVAAQLNQSCIPGLSYALDSVDATSVSPELTGVRTMVGSFHHMNPVTARRILQDAQAGRQPICIFELSDNSLPTPLWWISLPAIFLMSFLLTPFVRPLTWRQFVFTYLLPIVPVCFAWDGAVSNARTYTLADLDLLLEGLPTEGYHWEKGRITGRANKLYLLGLPA
ncbi:hypothetical protein LJY25_12025 [Hymenobacter sp. BT175]|uniref:hypothetical protein n=1 Tax=Hymenobacter translucens TaxID=2886507 RepID=UPI001D0E7E8C|nr:hypothetical protein [Hymenobacter translucens]MCC2547177.1 hypothetical protein [Hymenobacter translucens]